VQGVRRDHGRPIGWGSWVVRWRPTWCVLASTSSAATAVPGRSTGSGGTEQRRRRGPRCPTTTLQHLHDIAADQDPLPIADAVTSDLTVRDLPTGQLRQIGRWLAEYGTRRNAVALGILLLGLAGDHRDRDLLLLLGSLEDLSLYAAVALTRSQPDRDQALFDLARQVAGWGRIQTVRRLAGTQDPQIKAWLLRHGSVTRSWTSTSPTSPPPPATCTPR